MGRHNAAKTHCKRGHPLSGDNLRMRGNRRRCVACDKQSQRDRREARKVIQPCAICGVTPEGRSLCQDHDHRCCSGIKGCENCKRGWLCTKCNMALGLLQDDIEILEAAIAYLRRYGLD